MQILQLHSSGKSDYITQLEKEFLSQKREIHQSTKLSETEKIIKITALEKIFLRKKRQSDYFNF